MSNTTYPILPVEEQTERERYAKPDFRELVHEALGYHGEVCYDHLLRCLPEWRPASWFPKRWPDRVRRVLRSDARFEETSPGMWRLRDDAHERPNPLNED